MKKILCCLLVVLFLAGCQVNQNEKPDNVIMPPVPKEADWTLSVDDTIKKDIEGISIAYTMTLNAVKHGGTTDLGYYSGTATLKQKMDVKGLSNQFVTMTGGVDTELHSDSVQLEFVVYDREKYDSFGLTNEEDPLSSLTEPNGMALGAFTMSGNGNFDVRADAPQNVHGEVKFSKDGTGELSYKISLEGGQVTVSIPQLNLSDSFKGMITGVPK
jgi:energy-converting hydrogenase Eha subunit F